MKIEHPLKHNEDNAAKTGEWRNVTPVVDKEKCIGCGTCVKHCPDACIALKKMKKANGDEAKIAMIYYKYCKGCGVCAQVCPTKAIKMVSGS